MMLSLAPDIFSHRFDMRVAHAERPVSSLPRKHGIRPAPLLEPTGGRGLDLLDNLGQREVLGLRVQDMDRPRN